MKLSLERWNGGTDRDRVVWAEALARELPTGFTLHGVHPHELGGRRFAIATYAFDGSTFALVLAGQLELGFDVGRWQPNADEAASFVGSAEEYGFQGTLPDHVAGATLRPRAVELPALLVETGSKEVGWAPLDPNDPDAEEALATLRPHRGRYKVEIHGERHVRARQTDEGEVFVEEAKEERHADVAARFGSAGFRLPTSDEWEHLASGGARTLFRWGDHAPCDRYPIDASSAEKAWRREWVLSGGTLERPAGGFESDFDLHLRTNAFGLYIAFDPYKCEMVAEPAIVRGGDGGATMCSGAGFFLGWLTLATAYFEEHSCRRDPAEPLQEGYTVARRVLPLG